jgi:hypothetical protein
MDVAAFNSAFADARYKLRTDPDASVEEQQDRLRALIRDDTSERDRQWGLDLINLLAEPPRPPRQWGPLYHEAGQVSAGAYNAGGTVEERIAAIAEARRKIWEIADRAPADEEPHIRAMTRVLEHLENNLRDPPDWLIQESPGQAD